MLNKSYHQILKKICRSLVLSSFITLFDIWAFFNSGGPEWREHGPREHGPREHGPREHGPRELGPPPGFRGPPPRGFRGPPGAFRHRGGPPPGFRGPPPFGRGGPPMRGPRVCAAVVLLAGKGYCISSISIYISISRSTISIWCSISSLHAI